MMRKLIMGLFVTAVAALPVAARADWDSVKKSANELKDTGQKATNDVKHGRDDAVETEQQTVTTYHRDRGDLSKRDTGALKTDAVDLGQKGTTVEKKTVKTYKNGRNYAKHTTTTVKKQ
jgi:hypothetical protein